MGTTDGAEGANVLDLAELQAYVDTCGALRTAVGAPAGVRLELRPFAQGEYNANYAFDVPSSEPGGAPRPLLLRVNLGSQMHLADQIGYEAAALRLLAPSGRTPRVLYVDGTRERLPHGVLVEERLPGRPLRYETDLPRAARILADIHALPEPGGSPLVAPDHPLAAVVDECAAMFAVYRAWPQADPAVLARIDALFGRADAVARADRSRPAPKRRHIVNTELNSGNFLMNDSGAGESAGTFEDVGASAGAGTAGTEPAGPTGAADYLVDWEKPVLGEVEQDLAHFLAPTTTFWKTDVLLTRTEMDAFLDAYGRAVAGRFSLDGMRERFGEYLTVTCLRGVTWCAMALTEYLGAGRAATNPATFAKIQAYLEPAFLDFIAREYYGM